MNQSYLSAFMAIHELKQKFFSLIKDSLSVFLEQAVIRNIKANKKINLFIIMNNLYLLNRFF